MFVVSVESVGNLTSHAYDIQLGIDRQRAGLLDGAEEVYRAILDRQPNNADALNLLSTVERQRGRYRAAVELARTAIKSAPDSALFHLSLGESLRAAGEYGEAIAAYDRSISLAKGDYRVHHGLAQAYASLGDLPGAVSAAKRAVSLMPRRRELYAFLVALLMRSRSLEEAAAVCEAAIRFWPEYHEFYGRMGAVRAAQQSWSEAAICFTAALQRKANWPDAHAGVAQAFNHEGKYTAAERSAREALRLDPNLPRAYVELGVALEHQGRVAAAADPLTKAASLRPEDTEAHLTLGGAMLQQLEHRHAIEHLRRAVDTGPGSSQVHSNLLLALNYPSLSDERELFAEHRRWAEIHGKSGGVLWQNNRRTAAKRLRVGYVSPDFRNHPIAHFFSPILHAHSRPRVVPVIFSDVARPDGVTACLRSTGDEWHDTFHLDTDHFCEVVCNSKIDVLVDLAGHTAANRLPAFARCLAPVQVTYMGYPNTTGLPRNVMHFRLSDALSDPAGMTDDLHSELLYRLPETFLCYEPPQCATPALAPSANRRCVTFGSFNGMQKITPQTVDIWCEILRRVPCSRLLIKNRCMIDEELRERIRGIAARNGIDACRLVLLGSEATTAAHLGRFCEVDVALDTFPYNGTTTTCEAFWMGVPVVTMAGLSHRSRVGASLLTAVGLEDSIARNEEHYVEIAALLAADGVRQENARNELRARLVASPLMESKRLASSLESAFLDMYQTTTGGEL